MSGSYDSQDQNNPDVPVTVAAVHTLLGQVQAANAQSQAESRQFIQENGGQVIGGHSPVNSPTGAFMTPLTNPAPEYPPASLPPSEWDAGED